MTDKNPDPRFQESQALRDHLNAVRRVSPDFDFPLVDFWSPEIVDTLDDLHFRKGRIRGSFGRYRAEYYVGTDLPVELNIYELETGRRIAQDGSRDTTLLDRLRERCASALHSDSELHGASELHTPENRTGPKTLQTGPPEIRRR